MIDATTFGETNKTYLAGFDEDFEPIKAPITFKVFTGVLKAYRDEDNKRRLKGVASSTVKDRHGDEMRRSAIEDMVREANNNLTIFLNHSYNVPEDVAGSVRNAQAVLAGVNSEGSEIWDLHYDVIVNEANKRAVDAWEAIEGGTRLGLSIGAMIPEGGAMKNKKTGAYAFDHVDLLETSIVGIPANPRSWIQSAVKAIKSLEPKEPEPVVALPVLMGTTTTNATNSSITFALEPMTAKSDPEDVVTGDDLAPTPEPEVHTTDPDPGDSSQGASDSEPETEPASPEPTEKSVADAAIFASTVGVLERTVTELIETKKQLSEARLEAERANRERDAMASLSYQVLSKTSAVIDQIAALPIGRRAVVGKAQEDFSALESIYGSALLKLVRGD